MKKAFWVTIASLTALLTSAIPGPAQAQDFTTPKPNASCPTLGDIGVANGQMMTCKQSGSALKWHLETNVIAGGYCSPWTPSDTGYWAELQLLIKGKWVTQLQPIVFTPGPPCDTTQVNDSIPWIALPTKIADGTKYRWYRGGYGKDGHGNQTYLPGMTDPESTYTKKAMSAKWMTRYTAVLTPIEGPHVYAARMKSIQNTSSQATTTSTATPMPSAAPIPSASPTPIPSSVSTAQPSASPTPVITPAALTMSSFVASANQVLASNTHQIPAVAATPLSVESVAKDSAPQFIAASEKSSFSYLGPQPLSWSNGAVSMFSQNRSSTVYPSNEGNTPPWAASFSVTTADPSGALIVETSGFPSDVQNYDWRLAYRKSGGSWQYSTIAGYSHTADTTKYFDQVQLGSAGSYDIHLEFDGHTVFYGLGVDSTTKITASTAQTPNVLILGDSWVYPVINDQGPSAGWDAFPGALSYLTGWNVISDGVRGQGYLRASGGGTYKDRIALDFPAIKPDVVIFTGSPNDLGANYLANQIASELSNDIQLFRQKLPNALLIVASPFQSPSDINDAMKAAAKDLGVPYLDFIQQPMLTSANNGSNQLVNGHPTRAGGPFLAQELLKQIAAIGVVGR